MLYTYMLNLSKKELDTALNGVDGYKLTYRLHCFINIVFSIREKFNIVYENNGVFYGLKHFYNITKHDSFPEDVIKSMTLKEGEERLDPIFMDISNIGCYKNLSGSKHKRKDYDKYIKGKTIKEICDKVYKDTKNVLKKNNYV